MAGFVVGVALQLRQPSLWPSASYAVMALAAVAAWLLSSRPTGQHRRAGLLLAVLAGCAVGFAQTGWRAGDRLADALDPALEGRDLVVEGWVTGMPQRREGGLRFEFAAEGGGPLRGRLLLFWPDTVAAPSAVHVGERWRLTVRLRAPHGTLNPHGFDYELWLFEQGIPATGSVRPVTPTRMQAPAWWAWPLERAREAVRDRILDRTEGSSAGRVVAALVTGDQSAIAPAD